MDEANRRLAGILAADVVGYSAMIGADEPATLARVRALRTEIVEPLAAAHGGRLFKTMGDGFLAAFASAVQALRCAIAIQNALHAQPDGLSLRIGVHQGEVVAEGDDVLGDGVIIATRLEPLAEPGGICISARVREDAAGKMPLEVDDLGTPELKNIAARVRVFRVRRGAAERRTQTLPDRPSIAVLPFQNMSGDPEQEYFADGVVEEIITGLSRIPSLRVIACNSSFAYKGKTLDVRRVGEQLGVRYILGGSVRKAAGQVRIAGQLVDTDTGAHLWADRFEGDLTDIFQLQDRVTVGVVGATEPQIREAEIERALRKPIESLAAYDLFLLGRSNFLRGGKNHTLEAVRLLRSAIASDPNYACAYALLARSLCELIANHWIEPSEDELVECVALARTALRLGLADPDTLRVAAIVIALPGGNLPEGISIVDRALKQNPNSVETLGVSGTLRAYAGDTDTAFLHLKEADRLRPPGARVDFESFGFFLACFVAGDYAGVLEWTAWALQGLPESIIALRYRAAALGLLGYQDEAFRTVKQLRTLNPELTITRIRRYLEMEVKSPFKRPGVAEAYYEGLRLAGLPE
jgi:adenylate cyclase